MSTFESFLEGADPTGFERPQLGDYDIDRLTRRGRALQAIAMHQAIASGFKAVRRSIRRLTGLVLAPDTHGRQI